MAHHSANHTCRATLFRPSWAGRRVGPPICCLLPLWDPPYTESKAGLHLLPLQFLFPCLIFNFLLLFPSASVPFLSLWFFPNPLSSLLFFLGPFFFFLFIASSSVFCINLLLFVPQFFFTYLSFFLPPVVFFVSSKFSSILSFSSSVSIASLQLFFFQFFFTCLFYCFSVLLIFFLPVRYFLDFSTF